MGRIWLIGGTQESGQVAVAIARAHLPCTITVTTKSAQSLYPPSPPRNEGSLRVNVGRLTESQLGQFLHSEQIVAVLDASHPYAVEISQMAIEACAQLQIPYLRYERPSVDTHINASKLIRLDSFDTLLAGDYLQGERVLLTVGYKPLHLFRPWHDRASIFARILPSVTALEAAADSGIQPNRLIALRPPIPADLEKALWRHWEISLVVTKASGTPGGEDVKQEVAAELGIPLVVIDRPKVNYPQQTSDIEVALDFCQYYSRNPHIV